MENREFFDLIHTGDAEALRKVLARSPRGLANVLDASRNTPLHVAVIACAQPGAAECAALLVECGADVNARNARQETPLHAAAINNARSILPVLLQANADVNLTVPKGATALVLALEFKNEAVASEMLATGRCDVNACTSSGITALFWASRFGFSDVVERLLDLGADPKRTTHQGQTALHHAAQQRHLDVVKLLLRAGADVNARQTGGNTALMYATEAEGGPIVDELLKAGADPNVRGEHGLSPLYLAVYNSTAALGPAMVRRLVVGGADIDGPAYKEATAIFAAAEAPIDGCVLRFLLDCGARCATVRDDEGNVPLHVAVAASEAELVAAPMLLEHPQVSMFVEDAKGETPLSAAVPRSSACLLLQQNVGSACAALCV